MYLLDTNIVSELRKGVRANTGVKLFYAGLKAEEIYLSVQTIGELRRGIENVRGRGDQAQADLLEKWLTNLLDEHGTRILEFDQDCAQIWGKLMSPNSQHPIDKQIAAVGLSYNLTVVTRNTADFERTGVRLLNPFD